MDEVQFVDTTLRDGAQSLWAARFSTGWMLPMMADIDAAGFDGAEFLAPSQLVRKVRDFQENPWDWLKLGIPKAPNTSLRMGGPAQSSLATMATPHVVRELYLNRLAELGIHVARVSNCWNDVVELNKHRELLDRFGIRSVLNLIYTVSPRHTTEYFAERARQIAAVRPYRICIKDVGGMLTPERTRELVPAVLNAAGDIPVEFHTHCTNSLAPYNCVIAAELGIRIIHTAIPPLANGSSQPSIFNVAANMEAIGLRPAIELAPLQRVSEHLVRVARRTGLPEGRPAEFDQHGYAHQVPGGMISHLIVHLREIGLEDKLDATLEEAARVRAELGYPIMVTPLSQFVGTQAAINIMTGERYGTVTDEIVGYALGHRGAEAVEVMDPDLRARILDSSRARELDFSKHDEPSLAEVRQHYGGSISDEELILRCIVGNDAGAVYSSQPAQYPSTYDEYSAATAPFVRLAKKATTHPRLRHFELVSKGVSMIIERGRDQDSV